MPGCQQGRVRRETIRPSRRSWLRGSSRASTASPPGHHQGLPRATDPAAADWSAWPWVLIRARTVLYQGREGRMRISDVLRVKGAQVVTVTPDTTVERLVTVLAEHQIGAVVVSRDGTSVDGIVSERDIVRALARRGTAVMAEPVTAIYTAEVRTVTPKTELEEV